MLGTGFVFGGWFALAATAAGQTQPSGVECTVTPRDPIALASEDPRAVHVAVDGESDLVVWADRRAIHVLRDGRETEAIAFRNARLLDLVPVASGFVLAVHGVAPACPHDLRRCLVAYSFDRSGRRVGSISSPWSADPLPASGEFPPATVIAHGSRVFVRLVGFVPSCNWYDDAWLFQVASDGALSFVGDPFDVPSRSSCACCTAFVEALAFDGARIGGVARTPREFVGQVTRAGEYEPWERSFGSCPAAWFFTSRPDHGFDISRTLTVSAPVVAAAFEPSGLAVLVSRGRGEGVVLRFGASGRSEAVIGRDLLPPAPFDRTVLRTANVRAGFLATPTTLTGSERGSGVALFDRRVQVSDVASSGDEFEVAAVLRDGRSRSIGRRSVRCTPRSSDRPR